MLNAEDLAQFVEAKGIAAELVFLEVDTPTVADAAGAIGTAPEQIIKSVLFLADKKPVMVISSGVARLDSKRLADHLGVSRRRVRIASAQQVLAVTGFQAGAVPPFGHRDQLPTVLEQAVLTQDVVYGGGGEIHALMRLTVAELQRIVGSESADLLERN